MPRGRSGTDQGDTLFTGPTTHLNVQGLTKAKLYQYGARN